MVPDSWAWWEQRASSASATKNDSGVGINSSPTPHQLCTTYIYVCVCVCARMWVCMRVHMCVSVCVLCVCVKTALYNGGTSHCRSCMSAWMTHTLSEPSIWDMIHSRETWLMDSSDEWVTNALSAVFTSHSTHSTLQHTATHCNALQHTATHCNALHRTATHCKTLQLYNKMCHERTISSPMKHQLCTTDEWATHSTHEWVTNTTYEWSRTRLSSEYCYYHCTSPYATPALRHIWMSHKIHVWMRHELVTLEWVTISSPAYKCMR